VFPPAEGETSQYTLYQDAGDTREYQQGEAAWTTFTATNKSAELTVNIAPAQGTYPGMLSSRRYTLLLPGDWPPESVTVNGKVLTYSSEASLPGWRFEGNTLTTVVTLPAFPLTESVTVDVRRPGELIGRRAELDGFAGTMTRLREAYNTLNQLWPLGWSPDVLIDAMQTGDRLSYDPRLAAEQVSRLNAMVSRVADGIDELQQQVSEQQRQAITKRLNQEFKQKGREEVAPDYKDKLSRAKAALNDIAPVRK
jgi:alpha-glucosidase